MKISRGRRRKKLLDELKDKRGYSHLKEEALFRTMWRNRLLNELVSNNFDISTIDYVSVSAQTE